MSISRALRLSTLLIALGAIATAAKADTTIYSDGPTNGTYDGWTINNGFQVEDSFTVSTSSTLTSITFGNWVYSGDTALTVDWAIVSSEGSQTALFSGTGSLTGVYDFDNGYDVYDETFSLSGVTLSAGTYWLELQNEITAEGNYAYWDMNGGPSQVWESEDGDESGNNCSQGDGPGTCSDAFTIYGTTSTSATPEPGSLALLGSGITLLGAEIRRRRRSLR